MPNSNKKTIQHEIGENCSEALEEMRDKFSNLEEHVVNYVKENPLKAMGISLFAGAIFAQLMRSRSNKK